MHSRALILMMALLATGNALSESLQSSLIIESRSLFPGNSIPRKGAWLGLFCANSICVIKPVTVNVSKVLQENVIGEKEAADKVTIAGNPIAAFWGLALSNKPVIAPDYNGSDYRYTGKWSLGNRSTLVSRTTLDGNNRFKYYVSDGRFKQFLFEMDGTNNVGDPIGPSFRWVGDIDGDGEIDLLISMGDDSCGFDERLYLSSKKKEGELTGLAAQRSGYRPACGC